jgi:hypothetical protein
MRTRILVNSGIQLSIVGFCFATIVTASTARQDTTGQQMRSQMAQQNQSEDEIVLDVIEIKGRIEKPGVIIMPKRVEPEIGEVDLERSFTQEVKEGIGEIPKPEEELQRVDRIKSIKKAVKRKRE